MAEAIWLRESNGPCELHDMPSEGLPAVLIQLAQERHGKGGLNVCAECIRRARDQAAIDVQKREAE